MRRGGRISNPPLSYAGSKEQLTALLDAPPSSVTHALIRLLRPSENLITEAERAQFWRVFGVPLFEQIVDPSGRVIAWECEAHNGLHVGPSQFKLDEIELEGYTLDVSPCGCGKKTPRLRVVVQSELEQAAAAGTL